MPDVDATVDGLRNLVASLGDEPGTSYKEKVKGEILADVQREYQEALAMREQEIAQREQEIEVARSEAEAAARERAEQRARREQEEAAEAARRAEEDRLFEEVAREAERRTTVLMPDEGRESPEAVQASRDLPDAAVIEWQPEGVAPAPQAEPEPAPEPDTEPEPLPDAANTSESEGHIPGPQRVR